jgi:hypothetical protein
VLAVGLFSGSAPLLFGEELFLAQAHVAHVAAEAGRHAVDLLALRGERHAAAGVETEARAHEHGILVDAEKDEIPAAGALMRLHEFAHLCGALPAAGVIVPVDDDDHLHRVGPDRAGQGVEGTGEPGDGNAEGVMQGGGAAQRQRHAGISNVDHRALHLDLGVEGDDIDGSRAGQRGLVVEHALHTTGHVVTNSAHRAAAVDDEQ